MATLAAALAVTLVAACAIAPVAACTTAPAVAHAAAHVAASAAAHAAPPAVAPVVAPVIAHSATSAATPGIALEDLSSDIAAEIIGLHGKYPTCFGYALLLTFSCFLAQVFARMQELQAIQDAAAHVAAYGPSKVHIPQPAKLGTL
jgi:hypothetical protein